MALFLFLHAVKVDGNAEENRAIALGKLCNRLGIPYWRPALDKRRVDAALAIINQHLNDLNVDTRRALMSLRPSLVVPARYKIFARRRGTRICFTRKEFTLTTGAPGPDRMRVKGLAHIELSETSVKQ